MIEMLKIFIRNKIIQAVLEKRFCTKYDDDHDDDDDDDDDLNIT